MNVTFDDHTNEVSGKISNFADMLIGLMAADIDAKMKIKGEVPLLPKSTKWAQRGALRASIRHQKLDRGKYVVSVGENSPASAYAAAQEAGETRGHPIRHYSTPGTGAHFFQHAIDDTKSRTEEFIATAKRANGLGEI